MLKVFYLLLIIISFIVLNCGTPNDPAIVVDSGGYKILSRFATIGHAQDVIVDDTYAYVAQGEGGLLILDITDPKNPVAVSGIMGDDIKGYSFKIGRKDSAIYMVNGTFSVVSVDISNPLFPFVTQDNQEATPAKDIHILGIWMFVAVSENGVNIAKVDVSTFPDLRGGGMDTPGFARGISSSPDSNFILVACGEMGFGMFDISDMQNGYGNYPMVGWIDTPGYAEGIVSHPTETYAYLACGKGGFTIVNYSDSANLKIESTVETGGYAKEIFYADGKVFVTTEQRGLQIYDVTNVNAPVKLGTVATEYALGVAVDEKYVYLADEREGLIIIARP